MCNKLECLPAALAATPPHLSARGEEKKLNALNLLLLDGSSGKFDMMTDRRQCFWESATTAAELKLTCACSF